MNESTRINSSNQLGEPTNGHRKGAGPLSEDVVFDVLRDGDRRVVLEAIRDREGGMAVRELSEAVASRESETPFQQLSPEQVQRVRVALRHHHLPKLDEAGVVDYDPDRNLVERRRLADQLDPYLGDTGTGAAESERETTDVERETTDVGATTDESHRTLGIWTKYYMGTVVLGAALVAGHAAGVPGLSTLSGTRVALLVVVAFSLVTMFKIADESGRR